MHSIHLTYVITPFLAWVLAGLCKFLCNSWRSKKWAFGLIGYGGFPSNHSSIVASMVGLIAIRDGFSSPALGVAITLAFIVILDAGSLRRQIGRQAESINKLANQANLFFQLRERIGHTKSEIFGGMVLGLFVGCFMGWGSCISWPACFDKSC